MFDRLGKLVAKYWLPVVLAWLALAVGLKCVAPRWDDVTYDGDLQHLPRAMISVRGGALLKDAFPGVRANSQIAVVVARPDAPLSAADEAAIAKLADAFRAKKQSRSGSRQTSGGAANTAGSLATSATSLPILDVWTRETEVVGRLLDSADKQASLIVLRLSNDLMATDNIRVLGVVRATLDQFRPTLPDGLQLGVTGSAAIGGDMLRSAAESIQNTEVATIALVIGILLLVYRAPLLVLVPLATIAVSVSVSVDVIALATQAGRLPGFDWWTYKIFTTTKIFVVVILFGAGTDYCLFLIARYKEELSQGHSTADAARRSLGAVGGALAASALTTILGLATMFFADFAKFTHSGPTIAVGLTVTLLACLTLAPALLAAFGRSVFWPAAALKNERKTQAANASARAEPDRARPGRWRLRLVGFSGFWQWSADKILARPGAILLLALLAMAPLAYAGWDVPITYDLLGELRRDRPSVRGTELLRRHFAPGETGPLTVLAYRERGGFDSKQGEREIALLTKFLYDIPGVASVRSLAEPTGEPPGKTQLFSAESLVKLAAKQHPITKATFVAQKEEYQGRVARFDLILRYAPFSAEAIALLNHIETKLAELRERNPAWRDARFHFAGTTAGIRDLKSVTESDGRVIQQLVVIAVLAVLLVLLRHPLICLYLILSVLWSYFVTIGAAEVFFAWLYGPGFHGLDWKVPIFLFVILIAVGEDYNIYLVTRVFEEQKTRGPLEGLRAALARTGGIITSCGVIMAGTFVSMTAGSLRGMTELGFALSLGVLLDTFVVRTVLVPAFLALLARRQERRADSPIPALRAGTRGRTLRVPSDS